MNPKDPSQHFSNERHRWESLANEQPTLKGARFFADAFSVYELEAKRDNVLARAKELEELIDFRFIGPNTADGTMPLKQLIDILSPLESSLNAAAFHLRHGKEVELRQGSDVRDDLNLKLAGVGYGSARVFVVGDGRADLTGKNLLNETLLETFKLLNADDGDDFYDALDGLGGHAARKLVEALKKTEAAGLAADFTWKREEGNIRWEGSPQELKRVIAKLEGNAPPLESEKLLSGQVATVSDAGTIHIRDGETKTKIRFPNKLIREAKKLHIGATVSLRVLSSTFLDPATRTEYDKYTLIAIESIS
jgi:hypothetical protein